MYWSELLNVYFKMIRNGIVRITYCVLRNKRLRNTQYASYLLILFIIAKTFLSVSVSAALAQTIDAKVNFFIVHSEEGQPFTVGDQIKLRLEIKHPVNTRAILPEVPDEWEAFTVVDQTDQSVVNNNDGTATTGKDIIVSLYKPGSYQTPRLIVNHIKADGSTEDLSAPVIPIEIVSVLVEGDEELRDLKPQAELPTPPIWPLILASLLATLIVVGALAALGLWLYHRRKLQAAIPAPVPVFVDTRPPEVIAFAELERIEALDLPAKNQFKEHYSLLTNCLRRYIEGRYQFPALERTTGEIRTSFSLLPIPVDSLRDFLTIFIEGDFVKFARFRPGARDAYQAIHKARTIIEATTPHPDKPTVEEIEQAEPEVMA